MVRSNGYLENFVNNYYLPFWETFNTPFFLTLEIIDFYITILLWTIVIWHVFRKANIPKWKALIPVYRIFILIQKIWNKKWFVIYLFLLICRWFVSVIVRIDMANHLDLSLGFHVFLMIAIHIFPLLLWIFSIALNVKIATAFGKAKWFGLLMSIPFFLVGPIFGLYIALSKKVPYLKNDS